MTSYHLSLGIKSPRVLAQAHSIPAFMLYISIFRRFHLFLSNRFIHTNHGVLKYPLSSSFACPKSETHTCKPVSTPPPATSFKIHTLIPKEKQNSPEKCLGPKQAE